MKPNIFVTAFCLFSVSIMAQNETIDVRKSGMDSLKTGRGVIVKNDRKIRAGDQLTVSIFGHDELPKEIRVEADGTIKYPFMKDVKVDGMTTEQLSNILGVRLAQYLGGGVEVLIAFATDESIEVIILGQVGSPGAHKIPKNHTIQGAIASAGGPTGRGNLDKTKLIRINPENGIREEIEVPMVSIIVETGDLKRLPVLRNGDIIFIPAIYGAVYSNVIGAVGKPGNYELFPGANLVDVVFLAGGPTDEASIQNVKLIRRIGAAQTEEIVDIERILKAKGGYIPVIQPGDIIFVPAKKFTIKVFFLYLGYATTLLSAYVLYKLLQRTN